jgi:hypothetical protein
MKNKTSPFAAILFLITIYGCVPKSDYVNLKIEYNKLKKENEDLKSEVDDLKFGADRLLVKAKSEFDSKKFYTAKRTIDTLIAKHPNTNQAIEAKSLISMIDRKIKENEELERKSKIETEKAAKARIANATKYMRSKYDDIKGITWYYDINTPQYTNYNSFHIYIGKEKTSNPWLRFRIQYAADDWLFIESYIVKTDNSSYTIQTSYGEVERDNGTSGIWEWYDVQMDSYKYNMIKDILKSNNVKLRYEGQQYYKDRSITSTEKQGLKHVLDAFEALGGSLSF